MKKITTLMLCIAILATSSFALASCNKDGDTSSNAASSQATSSQATSSEAASSEEASSEAASVAEESSEEAEASVEAPAEGSLAISDELIDYTTTLGDGADFALSHLSAVPITDLNGLTYDTGLTSLDGIASAVKYEPMIGSTPFSLVVLQPADGADIAALKQNINDNLNLRKWVCVNADHAYIMDYDGKIVMVMSPYEDAEIEQEDSASKFLAYIQTLDGTLGEVLEKKFA